MPKSELKLTKLGYALFIIVTAAIIELIIFVITHATPILNYCQYLWSELEIPLPALAMLSIFIPLVIRIFTCMVMTNFVNICDFDLDVQPLEAFRLIKENVECVGICTGALIFLILLGLSVSAPHVWMISLFLGKYKKLDLTIAKRENNE